MCHLTYAWSNSWHRYLATLFTTSFLCVKSPFPSPSSNSHRMSLSPTGACGVDKMYVFGWLLLTCFVPGSPHAEVVTRSCLDFTSSSLGGHRVVEGLIP